MGVAASDSERPLVMELGNSRERTTFPSELISSYISKLYTDLFLILECTVRSSYYHK